MEYLHSNEVLEIHENQINNIRKRYNLDKPGIMGKSVDILEDWLKKQHHFKKTNILSRQFLEITIIVCKGSVERAKEKLDKLWTMKTLTPQYFIGYNVKDVFAKTQNYMKLGVSRHATEEECRLMTIKMSGNKFDPACSLNVAQLFVCLGEFLRNNDCADGGYILMDSRECDLKEALLNMNVLDMHQSATIMLVSKISKRVTMSQHMGDSFSVKHLFGELSVALNSKAYALRITGIHILSNPMNKVLEILIGLFKKVLGPKIGGRLMVHTSMDTINDYIPKSVLPKDYGGNDETLDCLHSNLVKKLTSDSFLEYFEEMRVACTDESLKPNSSNDQCIGLPGTFRMLNVD